MTQSTHSADCWKWHHECAIARIEEVEELREALKAALAEPEQIPPEAQTEAEKVAYCAGWWAAMQKAREMNDFADHLKNNPEQAKEFFQRAGILDTDGNLTEQYK